MFYIESERLRLIPLNAFQLQIYNDAEAIAQNLGLYSVRVETEPLFQAEFDDALQNHWLPLVTKYPEDYQWFTNWVIALKEEKIGVGGIGITGLPDEKGETEVGYGVDLHHRGKGYATEALACLAAWAFQHASLKTIIAHTPVDLLNSQQVLTKAGFQQNGMDDAHLRWELKRGE